MLRHEIVILITPASFDKLPLALLSLFSVSPYRPIEDYEGRLWKKTKEIVACRLCSI